MHGRIYDQWGSIVRTFELIDERTVWRAEQDVDGILSDVAEDRETQDLHGRAFRPVAKIPIEVVNRAMREGWMNDRQAWRRWLNDGDNRAFRVWQGRV